MWPEINPWKQLLRTSTAVNPEIHHTLRGSFQAQGSTNRCFIEPATLLLGFSIRVHTERCSSAGSSQPSVVPSRSPCTNQWIGWILPGLEVVSCVNERLLQAALVATTLGSIGVVDTTLPALSPPSGSQSLFHEYLSTRITAIALISRSRSSHWPSCGNDPFWYKNVRMDC